MTHPTPVIAIPARLSGVSDSDPRVVGANKIFHDVVALIHAAGLESRVVTEPDEDLSGVAGVVLPGGGDVHPKRYGGRIIPELYDLNERQDALDFAVAEFAITAGLPVYGICRGAQVLNVALGGTLHEDLAPSSVTHTPAQDENGVDEEDFVSHPVTVVPGTMLAAALGSDTASVESAHHQAVRDLGAGLVASAHAADGLTEAFEDRERWIVGVQWHPEGEPAAGPVRDGLFAVLAAEVAQRGRASA